MVDEPALLRHLYPAAVVVVTWVCTRCTRGWPIPAGRWRPTCGRCGHLLEQRGAHAAIPIPTAERQVSMPTLFDALDHQEAASA